jgi:hypothetical protein
MSDPIRVVSQSGDYPPCKHPYVSYHGMRAECQDCGEYLTALDENQALLDKWADGLLRKDDDDG